MKKNKKIITFSVVACIMAILSLNNVKALELSKGYKSTLDLPYGTIHSGATRYFDMGDNKISITVDGFNTSSGTVRKSGSTQMQIALGDVSMGRILKYDKSSYIFGTCITRNMGNYIDGYRYYDFFSLIYNDSTDKYDKYDGVKSSEVYMYPYPE